MPIIEGVGRTLRASGAPSAGTDEVQTITIGGTPTGGTFSLTFDGWKTAPIAWTATDATLVANIDAALEAVPNIGTAGVVTAAGTVSSGIGTITVTFSGAGLAKQDVPLMTASAALLTGTAPTVVVTASTPGVTATGRGTGQGQKYLDTANGKEYINTGTALLPVWVVTGSQS